MTVPLILMGLIVLFAVTRTVRRQRRRQDPFMRRHTDGVRSHYKRHP